MDLLLENVLASFSLEIDQLFENFLIRLARELFGDSPVQPIVGVGHSAGRYHHDYFSDSKFKKLKNIERKRENTPGECGRPTGVSDPLTPGDSEGLALEDSGSGSSSANSETMLVGAGIRTKPALYSEMEEEGYSRDVVKVALSRLVKAKHISDKQRPSLSVPFKKIPGARRTSIEAFRHRVEARRDVRVYDSLAPEVQPLDDLHDGFVG